MRRAQRSETVNIFFLPKGLILKLLCQGRKATYMLSGYFEFWEKHNWKFGTIVKNQVSVHVQMEICT